MGLLNEGRRNIHVITIKLNVMQGLLIIFSNGLAGCAVKTMHSRGESWGSGDTGRGNSVNTVADVMKTPPSTLELTCPGSVP